MELKKNLLQLRGPLEEPAQSQNLSLAQGPLVVGGSIILKQKPSTMEIEDLTQKLGSYFNQTMTNLNTALRNSFGSVKDQMTQYSDRMDQLQVGIMGNIDLTNALEDKLNYFSDLTQDMLKSQNWALEIVTQNHRDSIEETRRLRSELEATQNLNLNHQNSNKNLEEKFLSLLNWTEKTAPLLDLIQKRDAEREELREKVNRTELELGTLNVKVALIERNEIPQSKQSINNLEARVPEMNARILSLEERLERLESRKGDSADKNNLQKTLKPNDKKILKETEEAVWKLMEWRTEVEMSIDDLKESCNDIELIENRIRGMALKPLQELSKRVDKWEEETSERLDILDKHHLELVKESGEKMRKEVTERKKTKDELMKIIDSLKTELNELKAQQITLPAGQSIKDQFDISKVVENTLKSESLREEVRHLVNSLNNDPFLEIQRKMEEVNRDLSQLKNLDVTKKLQSQLDNQLKKIIKTDENLIQRISQVNNKVETYMSQVKQSLSSLSEKDVKTIENYADSHIKEHVARIDAQLHQIRLDKGLSDMAPEKNSEGQTILYAINGDHSNLVDHNDVRVSCDGTYFLSKKRTTDKKGAQTQLKKRACSQENSCQDLLCKLNHLTPNCKWGMNCFNKNCRFRHVKLISKQTLKRSGNKDKTDFERTTKTNQSSLPKKQEQYRIKNYLKHQYNPRVPFQRKDYWEEDMPSTRKNPEKHITTKNGRIRIYPAVFPRYSSQYPVPNQFTSFTSDNPTHSPNDGGYWCWIDQKH